MVDKYHCTNYAVNVVILSSTIICLVQNITTILMSFQEQFFTTFLDKIKDNEFSKELEIGREINSMIESISLYDKTIVMYASHRLRTKAQFSAIKKSRMR